MAFDLTKVMGVAQETKENSDNSDGVKLIYPQDGTLRVKLLFNPKSALVSRKILRHNIEGTKVACLSQYGHDCPLCQTINSIQNAKGLDLWKLKANTRGLSFAQFIGTDGYTFNNENDKPQVGEIVLLMYPWTIYQEINRIIAEAGSNAQEIVASNIGKVLEIRRWKEGNQVKYSAKLDAFNNHTSFNTDAEYEACLNDLDDLNEKIIPSKLTEDMVTKCRELSNQLSGQYLGQNLAGGPTYPQDSNPNFGQGGYNPAGAPSYGQGGQAPGTTPAYGQGGYTPGTTPSYGQGGYTPGTAPTTPAYGQGGYTPGATPTASPAPTAPSYGQGGQAPGTTPAYNPADNFNNGQSTGGQAPVNNSPIAEGFVPTNPSDSGTAGATKPANAPACFGTKNSGNVNPNTCLVCPFELVCSQAK